MRKKIKALDEMELYETIRAAYPERFINDDVDDWDDVMEFAEELGGSEDISDLLGRVLCMTMPAESPLTGEYMHVLGEVTITDKVTMRATAKRQIEVR